MSADERKEHICNVIRHKCKYPVSKARLDYIASRLNLGRAYLVKVTSDPVKFLNIATSEHIETNDKIFLSQIFPLYGRFEPGFFVKTEQEAISPVQSTIDKNQDAGAIKVAISYFPDGTVSSTYTLVLYEKCYE